MEFGNSNVVRIKWGGKRIYTFDDKVNGKSYDIPCKYKYTEEQIHAIMRKVKTFMATYVYVPCVISDCLMLVLQKNLEKKKLYKFKTKKDFLDIQNATRIIISSYENDFCNADYFSELSMSYYDDMEQKMKKFQKFIEVKLANLGYKNVGLASLSYLSFQMLCEGFVNYDLIMKGCVNDYDLDFKELFYYLCPDAVCQKAKRYMISFGLTKEFVEKFNEKKEVKKMFVEIEKLFSNPRVQKKAAKSARQILEDDEAAEMDEGGKMIQETLNEIETNNLKKKQNG